ncbi:hypothetical protein [Streptomyces sp. NPDC059015]|uniref:hypothetical protein n=1 Tax=unclassified Streptomyces TaxID=2593676 RepID=UPI0036CE33E5
MPDVGDTITATLVVAPHDATTSATLTVAAPDGTVSTPPTGTSDSGATWTAGLTYTQAGVWRLSWTVTGTGASVEHQLVSVAPAPGSGGAAGRTYATTTQLANYLGAAPPLDSARLLRQASVLLDTDFLLTAIYDVDTAGLPTDSEVAQAFADAVCAQVEFWGEVGEETDISGPVQGVSIGSVQLQFGAGDNRSGPDYYAPKLTRALASLPSDKIRFGVALGAC